MPSFKCNRLLRITRTLRRLILPFNLSLSIVVVVAGRMVVQKENATATIKPHHDQPGHCKLRQCLESLCVSHNPLLRRFGEREID